MMLIALFYHHNPLRNEHLLGCLELHTDNCEDTNMMSSILSGPMWDGTCISHVDPCIECHTARLLPVKRNYHIPSFPTNHEPVTYRQKGNDIFLEQEQRVTVFKSVVETS